MSRNIAIACGGTGGHLFPGLAVAEVLRARGHRVLLVVSEKEIDALALRGHDDLERITMPSVGMPGIFSPKMIPFVWRFLRGFVACRRAFRRFAPDAVLGMGGFTSTAPILAGRLLGVPAFLHESNAIPGKANLLNARFCRAVLLGFEDCARHFPAARTEVCGTPVRASLRAPVDRSSALAAFGLSADRLTLAVMGGSQGAHGLNEAVLRALPAVAGLALQVIHLTGGADAAMAEESYRRLAIPAWVSAFHHDMGGVFAVADAAVSRAGASSLSELAWFGTPAILIPYPHAAEDHQTLNAAVFQRAGAAEMIRENETGGGRLDAMLYRLFSSPDHRRALSEAARRLAPGDAAERIADVITATGGTSS